MSLTIREFKTLQKDHPYLRVEVFWNNGLVKIFVVDRANEVCSWFDVQDDVRAAANIVLDLNRDNKGVIEVERHSTLSKILIDVIRHENYQRSRLLSDNPPLSLKITEV